MKRIVVSEAAGFGGVTGVMHGRHPLTGVVGVDDQLAEPHGNLVLPFDGRRNTDYGIRSVFGQRKAIPTCDEPEGH